MANNNSTSLGFGCLSWTDRDRWLDARYLDAILVSSTNEMRCSRRKTFREDSIDHLTSTLCDPIREASPFQTLTEARTPYLQESECTFATSMDIVLCIGNCTENITNCTQTSEIVANNSIGNDSKKQRIYGFISMLKSYWKFQDDFRWATSITTKISIFA